ncbi:transcription-repair coupling factor [Candidatus Schneideria nysicola]|uniref:transcription-repair coupling factor n=1 Tax=Candidatus Schneideria nysicola TaxID=1081631 RepID=UPI001CAA69F4|nr:transcription-repair coupling factor [Candidatus Schneideria nysicola]UAJ66027.1 transcription-repair coupling factor [Candidatus Schneideria nysicola]
MSIPLFKKRITDFSKNNKIHNLDSLQKGDPIVHIEHGIGRYAGTTILETNGIKSEYLTLIYAEDSKLYVPVSSLNLVSRYIGINGNTIPLNKLGNDNWSRIRKTIFKKIKDIAVEILATSSKRAIQKKLACRLNSVNYRIFCEDYPFDLTSDQMQAINAVLHDMCQPVLMDRLICGDVGFGKTEIAIRATFLAIDNKRQVAILVPTTLLAHQHFDEFSHRFAKWNIRVEMLSRFRSLKERKKIIKKVANGEIDILIGTHIILQDIKWFNLGLLIIDEEHRFGVSQKEKIQSLYVGIDVLVLTATPIPRTLNMAIYGLRDLSIIATPPAQRLAVKTIIEEYNINTIKKAILYELKREGQIYYVCNNVRNIEKTKIFLQELIPGLRVSIGHGQMCEKDLEKIMVDFHHKKFTVLVCTTIIETGIHITNVNTIIIDNADRFGLAQLYQLRGRVGRSNRQGYAYFLTTPSKKLDREASERLKALSSLEKLGSGFTLSTYDLEIRGAGDFLGKEQSGQINTIGLSLYMDLLKNAINTLEYSSNNLFNFMETIDNTIELNIPFLIPNDYISDVSMRLQIYKKISNANDMEEIEAIKKDLIQHFGKLPDIVNDLFNITLIKKKANSLGIKHIIAKGIGKNQWGIIEFSIKNYVNLSNLVRLIQSNPSQYQFNPVTQQLKFCYDTEDSSHKIHYIEQLLRYLA